MKRTLASLALLCCWVGLATSEETVVQVVGGDEAKLARPFGVDFDKAGNMYIAEYKGHRVRKLSPTGKLTVFAGLGSKGDTGDGGPAGKAQFDDMHTLLVHPSGDVYVADTMNHKIRKIDSKTGVVTTVAGTGEAGFSGDGGPATKAKFNGVFCIAFDASAENVYVADLRNRRIRKVSLKSGTVTTVAGNGKRGVPKDGADATLAPLVDPRAVAVDKKGNVYVLERGGHALRVVDPSGKIRTVAGTGKAGFGGDGGPALKARMRGPKHLCIDRDGTVLIADTENHVIRRYVPESGRIVRVMGSGKKGADGLGGPPASVELNQPHGVCVRASGELYVADSTNDRVLKLKKD